MLRSIFATSYSYTHVFEKGTVKVAGAGAAAGARAGNYTGKNLWTHSKNSRTALLLSIAWQKSNIQIDNTENCDGVISMFNLQECSSNCKNTWTFT